MSMNDESYLALTIGIAVPVIIVIIIVIVVCINRCRATPTGYSQVNHALDDEEMEFKRMIEMQSSHGQSYEDDYGNDDIDDLYSDTGMDEDVTFDSKDMNRLSMLEKYRNNLVSAGNNDTNINKNSNYNNSDHIDESSV